MARDSHRTDRAVEERTSAGAKNAPVVPGGAPAAPVVPDEVARFLATAQSLKAASGSRGRLIFAMDATMSRRPTWDAALATQGDMFSVVASIGSLDVQLVYFRGASECRASRWVGDAVALAGLMRGVTCAGGYTQIGKVLAHARREAEMRAVSALVHVGDCVEEPIDDLCGRAGELALLNVPAFLFQEGGDAGAARCFAEIARITKGAHCRFDAGSAEQLRQLLRAVAVYAAGGRKALLATRERGAKLLIEQMR
jgi:hypothetical protein